ncbi:MAG: TetR/AcrR family transcriptional regulator [Psychromonas sp.]
MTEKSLNPRSEQKRQQILEAAGALFNQLGYAVSMSTIAKQADVSKQTVYSHFKTKDELFERCIKEKCVANKLESDLCNDLRPIRDVLSDFAFNFQTMLMDEMAQETLKIAISQRNSHPELSKAYLQAGPKYSVQILADYLQMNVDKGTLKLTISATEAAMQLLLMFHGKPVYFAYLGEKNDQSEPQRRSYLNNCVDIFLAGNSGR